MYVRACVNARSLARSLARARVHSLTPLTRSLARVHPCVRVACTYTRAAVEARAQKRRRYRDQAADTRGVVYDTPTESVTEEETLACTKHACTHAHARSLHADTHTHSLSLARSLFRLLLLALERAHHPRSPFARLQTRDIEHRESFPCTRDTTPRPTAAHHELNPNRLSTRLGAEQDSETRRGAAEWRGSGSASRNVGETIIPVVRRRIGEGEQGKGTRIAGADDARRVPRTNFKTFGYIVKRVCEITWASVKFITNMHLYRTNVLYNLPLFIVK